MSKYELYKALVAKLNLYEIESIPLDLFCGTFLAFAVYEPKVFYSFKQKLKRLFFVPRLSQNIQIMDGRSVVSWTTNRQDYREIIAFISGSLKNPLEVRLPLEMRGQRWRFSWKALRRSFAHAHEIKEVSFKDKVKVLLSIYPVLNFWEYLDCRLKCGFPREVVCLNGAYFYEAALCNYFRIKGVKTVSLQHGALVNYLTDTPKDFVNVQLQAASELWVWGQYFSDQVSALVPKHVNIKVKGYPRANKAPLDQFNHSVVLVCLPREQYNTQSLALVRQLISDFEESDGVIFYLRPHPTFNKELVSALVEKHSMLAWSEGASLWDDIQYYQPGRAITFNSTVIFELLAAGIDVANYSVKPLEFDIGTAPVSDIRSWIFRKACSPILTRSTYYIEPFTSEG